MQTHFQVLELTPSASPEEIHEAYKRKSLDLHPDLHPGREEEFLKVRDAYEILKSETEKQKYIALLRLTSRVCPLCGGQGVTWKQRGFTGRASSLCTACGGAGYE